MMFGLHKILNFYNPIAQIRVQETDLPNSGVCSNITLATDSMRTLSFMAAVASLFLFIVILSESTAIHIIHHPGLINPTYKIDLLPGKNTLFIFSLLFLLINTYFWMLVVWVDIKTRPASSNSETQDQIEEDERTMKIRQIKEAIRSCDLEVLQNCILGVQDLPIDDDQSLTPLELAELYGNGEIIALVKSKTMSITKTN